MLIRHGDSDYEINGLTETGKREAELLAGRIAPMEISEYFVSTIPADDREMDRSLFCKDCQTLLSELPDSGYVIADMQDPGNLSLFPIQTCAGISIREYEVTVTTSNDGAQIEVEKAL